jgi:hypothetical protein
MHLQAPILSGFPLFRINNIVLFPRIIHRCTRIPYTKLAVFIFHGGPRQPANPRPKVRKCTLTAKEDQIHGGIRMVRRTVDSILSHLRPRNNLHVLQSLAQRRNLDSLILVLLEHKCILICSTPGVPFLQYGLQPRVKPGERARLPLLSEERFKIKLAMPWLLRLSRELFRRKALLLFPPSLSLLFLLRVV